MEAAFRVSWNSKSSQIRRNVAQADYYKTLGVATDVTQDVIKKKYRELARKFHPDLNPSPQAATKFKQINEAYQVVGDADRRAVYDAERALRQNMMPPPPSASRPASPATTPRRANNPQSQRPNDPTTQRPNTEYNGYGTVRPNGANTPRPNPAPPQPPRPAPAQNRATSTFGTVERLIAEAQLAYINRRYREAEDLCGQILMIDRRSAVAHEILGDIYVKRGRTESAVTAYSYAAQFNPRNFSVQTKLERLSGQSNRPTPTVTRPVDTKWDDFAGTHQETLLIVTSGVVLILVGIISAFLYNNPGQPTHILPPIANWSMPLIAALLLNGVLGGLLLAINGGMHPIVDELFSRTPEQEERNTPVTLGILLALFSVIWFYAAFLIYIGIGFARNRFSPSVMRAFGLTIFLILLHAGLHTNSAMNTLLFGGNVLLPTVLFGWAVGDAFRLRSR